VRGESEGVEKLGDFEGSELRGLSEGMEEVGFFEGIEKSGVDVGEREGKPKHSLWLVHHRTTSASGSEKISRRRN